LDVSSKAMLFLNAVRLTLADLGVLTLDDDNGVHPKQVAALCLKMMLQLIMHLYDYKDL